MLSLASRHCLSFLRAWGLGLVLGALAWVGPRAGAMELAFSEDGRFLSVLSETGGLAVFETVSGRRVFGLRGGIRGGMPAWRPGREQFAAALDEGEGWDLWLIDLNGPRRRLTRHPAREHAPCWIEGGEALVFVGWQEGDADLYRLDLATRGQYALVAREGDQLRPRSAAGSLLLFDDLDGQTPAARLLRPGSEARLLEPSQDPRLRFEAGAEAEPLPRAGWEAAGRALWTLRETPEGRTQMLWSEPERLTWQALTDAPRIVAPLWWRERGWLFYEDEAGLAFHDLDKQGPLGRRGPRRLDWQGARLGAAALSPAGEQLAAVVEERAVALGRAPGREWRLLLPERQGARELAGRLYRSGRLDAAEAICQTLRDERQSDEERLALLRWQAEQLALGGWLDTALERLERAEQAHPAWASSLRRLRARLTCVEGDGPERALEIFDDPEGVHDWVRAARAGGDLARAHAALERALRRQNATAALDAMEKIAAAANAPTLPLARELVLENWFAVQDAPASLERRRALLEGLAQRPPTDGPLAGRLAQERLTLALEARDFPAARALLPGLLDAPAEDGLDLDSFLDFYLEADRQEAQSHRLLGEVLLAAETRALVESALGGDPLLELRLELARIKYALLQGDTDRLAPNFDRCRRAIDTLETNDPDGTDNLRYLLALFRAKYHEARREWPQALQAYETALTRLESGVASRADEEFQLYAAYSQLRAGSGHPETLDRLLQILRGLGDPLINPTNDARQLRIGARNLAALLRRSPPSPLEAFMLYRLGAALSAAGLETEADRQLRRALGAFPPESLRSAILWERADLNALREAYWLESRDCEAILELNPLPALADLTRLRLTEALLRLGRLDEARRILLGIRDGSSVPAYRTLAQERLDTLEEFPAPPRN